MPISNKVLRKEIIINCSVQDVWKIFDSSDGINSFFNADSYIEFKPLGKFEIYFDLKSEAGQRGTEGCKLLSYIPFEMISFTWNAPPSIPSIRALGDVMWVVINLEVIDLTKTKIILRHFGWKNGDDWGKTYLYFDHAWNIVLERFQEKFD